MLADDFLPVYDVSDEVATVVDADSETVWEALMNVDLLDVGKRVPFAGVLVVLVPGAPLVPILFITQAINAVLLLPLLAFIALLTRDRSLMGQYATGRAWTVVIVAVTLMIAAATVVLGVVLLGG